MQRLRERLSKAKTKRQKGPDGSSFAGKSPGSSEVANPVIDAAESIPSNVTKMAETNKPLPAREIIDLADDDSVEDESSISGADRNPFDLKAFDTFRYVGGISSSCNVQSKFKSQGSSALKRKYSTDNGKVSAVKQTSMHLETKDEAVMRQKDIEKWSPLRDFSLVYESLKFQIVVAAILSKQTQFSIVLKAINVMKSEPELCDKGNLLPAQCMKFDEQKLKSMICFVHYNKQKAKHVIKTAEVIQGRFRGKVPTTQHYLQSLPGIGPTLSAVIRNVTPTRLEYEDEQVNLPAKTEQDL
mmetsp:Transcript_30142/g.73366  ORF Transcript_30142/g.73366 Transcript_30142/m.73366 type:complete len:299 (+) Transcript_30142:107-1003(+)